VTPAVRREAVTQLRVGFEVSERRACTALEVDRSSVRYRSSRPDDAMARARLRELAAVRRRFGYRRLHILMSREGLLMNHKKFRRLYREERLQVRRRGGRKRALGTRAPMAIPQGLNQRWSLDFLSDTLADGRRFRILAVVDDFTRECLALVADTSLPGLRVVRELDAVIAVRGRPAMCVSDNGTELTSIAILRWSQETRIEWHITSRPASRSRTLSSRASTGGFVTSCSMRRCSPRSSMRGRCSPPFKMTTTRSGHTAGSAICRRLPTPDPALLTCNGPGRLSYLGAPRPVPLHHRATRAQMKPGLYSSLDERRGSGHTEGNLGNV